MSPESEKPALIIFLGGMGGSAAEEMIANSHLAITLDLLEGAQQSHAFEQVIVLVDREQYAEKLGSYGVSLELSSPPFHFGKQLHHIVSKYKIAKPFYLGGGSAPLLSPEELYSIAQRLSAATSIVITNNIYSADLIAFTPGTALEEIALPTADNPLAQLLAKQAKLPVLSLPRTAATQFDVDTPTDLLVLQLHPGVGRHTQEFLRSLSLDSSRLRKALSFFTDSNAEIVVAGRVGSYVWSCLEKETECRVRVLSEERGMHADGREERKEVHSLLGFFWEQVGTTRFFAALSKLGEAAFMDTRVLFRHLKLDLPRGERFLSDLGWVEQIKDHFLREFTQAALEAPLPVVLGGHSLVSGGLLALLEIAHHSLLTMRTG